MTDISTMTRADIDVERNALGTQKLALRRTAHDRAAVYRDRLSYAERMFTLRAMPNWLAVLPAEAVEEIRRINRRLDALNRRDEEMGIKRPAFVADATT